jgi:hypothetical protein
VDQVDYNRRQTSCQLGVRIRQHYARQKLNFLRRHSATVVNDTQIWVFGGEAVGGCTSNLYVLDTKTLVWSRPSTEGAGKCYSMYQ